MNKYVNRYETMKNDCETNEITKQITGQDSNTIL